MPDDLNEDLIRTGFENLEDPEWWRRLDADGVVFYGWGSGKYRKIARAIKRAGIVLVTHMDTGGLISILNGPREYVSSIWRISRAEQVTVVRGFVQWFCRCAYASTVGLILTDVTRAQHLQEADIIGAIAPVARERIQKVCLKYGGEDLARRVVLIPHPIAPYMVPDPERSKERLVVAIGRWDDEQIKGTQLLMEAAERIFTEDPAVVLEVYGNPSATLLQWEKNLDESRRQRVVLKGVVSNTEVTLALMRARVSICTSLRESFHIVSAEALCCGCSVVGADRPELPSMKWLAKEPHGTMVARTAAALAGGVIDELHAWDRGKRDPNEISQHWSRVLHAPNVARRIIDLAHGIQNSKTSSKKGTSENLVGSKILKCGA